jgi:hypothetical protein
MPSTNVAYAAALDIQHYIVPMRMSSITLEDAATAAAGNGALLSAWLDASTALSGVGRVDARGSGSSFVLEVGSSTKTISNATLQDGTVTLTLSTAAGVTVGSTIAVAGLTGAFVSLNTAAAVVTGVTTVSPFTISFAKTGTNIASGSATGTVTVGTPYALNGTGSPIQLSNVTGMPFATNSNTESVITHDQVTRGSAITIALSDTTTGAMKGMTVHKALDHKVLEVLRQFGTAEQLACKYLRVGPGGTTEKRICYAQISSKQEEGDAGALVKFGATLTALGTVYTIFDNNA